MGQALIARLTQQQAKQSMSAAAAEAGVPSNPDAVWWLKLLARTLGIFLPLHVVLMVPMCICTVWRSYSTLYSVSYLSCFNKFCSILVLQYTILVECVMVCIFSY